MHISTLRRTVQALGGELSLVVQFPGPSASSVGWDYGDRLTPLPGHSDALCRKVFHTSVRGRGFRSISRCRRFTHPRALISIGVSENATALETYPRLRLPACRATNSSSTQAARHSRAFPYLNHALVGSALVATEMLR